MKVSSYSKLFCLSCAITFFSLSCQEIKLRNLTPSEFPAKRWLDWSPDGVQDARWIELQDLGGFEEHRFRLDIKTENIDVRTITAYIVLDGIEHTMVGSNAGVWYYDSPEKCRNNEYLYSYRVDYESSTKTLGSANPFSTDITANGRISWFELGHRVEEGDFKITLKMSTSHQETIVLQNLCPFQVRITQLGFHTLGSPVNGNYGQDNNKFGIQDLPTLPYDLDCGESIKFIPTWVPLGSDYHDRGLIIVNVNQISSGDPPNTTLLYDIDFASPPHVLGQIPVTGVAQPPRNTISRIIFGAPIVSTSLGELTNQPLVFDSHDGQPDQILLDLYDLQTEKSLIMAVDVCIDNMAANEEFSLYFDLPYGSPITFTADGTILEGNNPIGEFEFGKNTHLQVEIDLDENIQYIAIDNQFAHSGDIGDATAFRTVRFTTSTGNPSGLRAAIDNILIKTTPGSISQGFKALLFLKTSIAP